MSSTRESLQSDQRGTTTVEYIILMVCILGLCYGGWEGFGKKIVEAISGS